jgi:peptidyl-prolyl cis-trans isomerase A (cyclophilin A)
MTIDAAQLVLETGAGSIVIAVDSTGAPETARYVRNLVDTGCFDGATFYRSTNFGIDGRLPLIQGGPLAPLFTGSGDMIPKVEMFDVVEPTTSTGLAHVRGTVSLARDLVSTGHVLPELFICLDASPELDAGGRTEPDSHGFPAFEFGHGRPERRCLDRCDGDQRGEPRRATRWRNPHRAGRHPSRQLRIPTIRKQHLRCPTTTRSSPTRHEPSSATALCSTPPR